MSKQQGYQPLSTEVPNGEAYYGFAARLPQAGASHPPDGARDVDVDFKGTGTGGVAPVQYPAAAYAGVPVPVMGYPAMPMAGPVGMVVPDPLGGRCGRKRARRMACAANGCRGCRECRGCRGCHRRRGGPVHLLFRLARSAFQSAQDHRRSQPPAPAHKAGFIAQ